MPYNLRPERKLRRPARFSSVSTDETEPSLNCTATNPPPQDQDLSPSTGGPGLPTNQQSQNLPRTSSQHLPAPREVSERANAAASSYGSKTMTNPKSVKKTLKRKYVEDEEDVYESVYEAGPSAPRRALSHPSSHAARAPSMSIFPSIKPAAFPSLSWDEPPQEPYIEVKGQPGVRGLMEARERSDRKGIDACIRSVDGMYANKRFPASIDEREKKWYRELKVRLKPNEGAAHIEFASLYASLRQTIIDRIRDDFSERAYYDGYHPVRCILQLSQAALDDILRSNERFSDPTRDLPAWLLDRKAKHPNAIIDPDEPPRGDLIRAIEFLKQQHLPGSLLGEWQYPLPSIEDFLSFERPRPGPSRGSFISDEEPIYGHFNRNKTYQVPFSETNGVGLVQHESNTASRVMPSGVTLGFPVQEDQNKKQRPRKKARTACHLCQDPDHRAFEYNEAGGHKCPVLQIPSRAKEEEVRVLIEKTNLELAELNARTLNMGAARENHRAQQIAAMLNNMQLLRRQPEPPITTVDQLQTLNRNNPGLRPNTASMRQIRSDLGFPDEPAILHQPPYRDPSMEEDLGRHDPIEMTSSAAEYAQMSTINSLAAHEQMSTRRVVRNDDDMRAYPNIVAEQDASEHEDDQYVYDDETDVELGGQYAFQMEGPPEPDEMETEIETSPTDKGKGRAEQVVDSGVSGIPSPGSPDN